MTADRAPARRAPYRSALIDRYVVGLAARPLALSLGVVLIALLLERVLRLVNLLAATGGPFEVLILLAANLVPHYLGLALPAAFFVAIFVVVTRLDDDHELDAMLASGLSVGRVILPLAWIGCALAVTSLIVFGFLEPYTRYGYRAVLHSAINAGWDARVPPTTFIDAGRGFTITADDVDPTGRRLEGVFIQRLRPEGEEVTTAASGDLELSPDRSTLILTLQDGMIFREPAGQQPETVRFKRFKLDREFDIEIPPFRPRGGSEREMTLPELWAEMQAPWSPTPRARLESEFHVRIARALSLPLLPLLGVPLGMAAKRQTRSAGLVAAGLILVTYHHALQLGESLGDTGLVPAPAAVWSPFALFATFCVWLFMQSRVRPGETPFTRLFERLERATASLGRWRRWRGASATP